MLRYCLYNDQNSVSVFHGALTRHKEKPVSVKIVCGRAVRTCVCLETSQVQRSSSGQCL